MDPHQCIYWHQGMFLQPQHFQCSELATRFQASALYDANPPMWGVGALCLDAAGLGAGRIEVRHVRLLLHDHTLVEYPGNAVLAPRSLQFDAVDPQHGLDVYIGARRLDPNASNVTVCADSDAAALASTRFATLDQPLEVTDIHADDPPVPIHRLANVLRLFLGSEGRESGSYELIRIARLIRVGPHVATCSRFAPPAYALAGAPALAQLLAEVRDATAACSRRLGTSGPTENDGMLVRVVLARGFMTLAAMTEAARHVHPCAAYARLCEYAAELRTLAASTTIDVVEGASDDMVLPPYAHEAAQACFARAHHLAMRSLAALAPGPAFLRAFAPTEQRDVQSTALPPDTPAARGAARTYWLLAHPRAGSRWLDSAPAVWLRVAAAHDMRALDQHALPGLPIDEAVAPPPALPRRPGSRCFCIETSGPLWAAALATGTLAVHWPGSEQQVDLELAALRGRVAS